MNKAIRPLVLIAALVAGIASAADAPSAKWRVHVFGTATSAGELHLRVTPASGEPILVNVKIPSGRGGLFMAKDVQGALKAQLPHGRFKSDVFHGEEVLLKSGRDEPAFTLELVDSTVSGTKVKISAD